MSAPIQPKTITVDALSVRYAEGGQDGPDAILMSPWPESIYAFEPAWPHLAAAAHLVALVGGGKQRRQNVETERALAVLRLPPISDRNVEDDLAFGVTFLDILMR
jgi:hypothetical protein